MGNRKAKLTEAPKRKKRSEPSSEIKNGQAPTPPDLSHIIEPLRPFAVPVSELHFDPANARTHGDDNLDAIRGSLAEYQQRTPLVVNRKTGYVEKGNGTLAAALSLGHSHLAAVYVEDDPGTANGYSLADNRAGDLAEWDRGKLEPLLASLREEQPEDPRLAEMLRQLGRELEPRRRGETNVEFTASDGAAAVCSKCGQPIPAKE
jgi:ParB-like chromosome segregation protein Spo0J